MHAWVRMADGVSTSTGFRGVTDSFSLANAWRVADRGDQGASGARRIAHPRVDGTRATQGQCARRKGASRPPALSSISDDHGRTP